MSGSVDANAPVAQSPVLPPPTRNPFDGPNSWSNLMLLSGDMTNATNARTSGGFLANPGMSAFTAGLGALPGQVQQLDIQGQQAADAARAAANASTQAGATLQGTLLENEQRRLQNLLNQSNLTWQQQLNRAKLQELQQGDGVEPGTDGAPAQPPAVPGKQSSNDAPTTSNVAITDPAIKARIIDKALAANGMTGKIDPAVVDSLIEHESSWRPGVLVAPTVTKPDGTVVPTNSTALGLGQTEKSTAASPGMGIKPVDYKSLTDPQTSANFIVAQLKGIGQSQYHLDTPDDWNNPGHLASVLSSYHGPQDAFGTSGQGFATGVMSTALQKMAARAKAQQQASANAPTGSDQQAVLPMPLIPPPGGAPSSDQSADATPAPSSGSPASSQTADATPPTSMRSGGPDPSTLPTPSFQQPDTSLPTKPYQVASTSPDVPVPSHNQPGMNLAPDNAKIDTTPSPANAPTPTNAPAPVPQGATSTPDAGKPQQVAQANPAPAADPNTGGSMLPSGYVTPELAMQKAAYWDKVAARKSLIGDPSAAYAARTAEQWHAYAEDTMKNAAQPHELRGEGSAVVGPNGVVQTPISKQILGPDSREYTITMNTLDNNGQPQPTNPDVAKQYPWVPQGTQSVTPSKLAPGEEDSMKEASKDAFGEQSRASYQGAQVTLANMANMRAQLDALNAKGTGYWTTGAAAGEKMEFAKTINSAFTMVGANPPFDVSKVASYEDLVKQSKTAGFALARSMGSHEAATVVTQALSTVPNIENSPQGAKIVLNSIEAGAKNIIDQHSFNASWAQNPNFAYPHNPNDMRGADVAFQQLYSPQKYVDRALSLTNPVTPKPGQTPADFLPGTLVRGVDANGQPNVQAVRGDPAIWNSDGSLKYQPAPYNGPGVKK